MEITWMWSQTYWGCVTLNTLLDPLGLCFFYSGDNVTLSISSVEYEDKMRLQTKDRATGTRKPRKGFFFFSGEVITTLSQLHCLPIKQMSFLHLKSASRLCLFLPTKWNRAKVNRVSPREHTGHRKHPLLTTQEKTLHMDITRWSTLKSDWLYSLQPKMEKLYIVSKNNTGSWLWLRSWTPYCQIQT